MTLFICPCGTSIVGPPGPASIEERIAAKLTEAEAKSDGDLLKLLVAASAETNGLARSNCGPGDQVILLASDTPEGKATANVVGKLVEQKLGASASTRSIEGLQVGSAQDFRRNGIRNLIRVAKHEVESAKSAGKDVVFNVTGGFKAVVPYLTLLGMFEDVDIVYVYEQSDELIRLPALPVRFDQDRVAFVLPALQVLAHRGVMLESEFWALLPGQGWHDDPVFTQLMEEADGMVSVSGAGELALAGVEAASGKARLLLHRRARQSAIFDETHVQRTLALMTDPPLRSIKHHCAHYDNTDMLVWKEYGGPAPRIFYWVEGNGDVFVADILPHDIHQREFVLGKMPMWRRDYPAEGFTESAPESIAPDTYGEALSRFIQHNDQERGALAKRVAVLETEIESIRGHQERARARNTQLQDQLEEAARKAAGLSDALARAEQASQRLLSAAAFAADAHRNHRRKDAEATPYINHPVEVARILAEEGKVTDLDVLTAALVHDTIEDTDVSAQQLEDRFGKRVRNLVEEVTDDKSLPKERRKQLQIEHAAEASPDAKLIKLGDKIANLRDLVQSPPADWPPEREREYFAWAKAVVDRLRGIGSPAHKLLEARFDRAYAGEGKRTRRVGREGR
jgi:guanosine-3',5'-bis(diphosphate) 3'-pyrophosphohydrolase